MAGQTDIDATISAREAQIAQLRRNLEIAEAELRGMKLMRDQIVGGMPKRFRAAELGHFSVSGSASGKNKSSSGGYRGGRQPGAISNTWKSILSDAWHECGDVGFMESKLVAFAARHGINLKPSDARGRMLSYAAYSYVEENPDHAGMWRVTQHAADKFGFNTDPLKNETPSTEAPGPQESLDPGDQTGAE
jgi:hypothetical protein